RLPLQGQQGVGAEGGQGHLRQLAGGPGRQGKRRSGRTGQERPRRAWLRRAGVRDNEQAARRGCQESGWKVCGRDHREHPGGARPPAPANTPADFGVSLTNPPGDQAYPIASFTWLLVYRDQGNEAKGKALVKFPWWAIHDGQKYPGTLLYAPLPAPVVKQL